MFVVHLHSKFAMETIFKKLKSKDVTFNHVCEVGVYLPETSNIKDFIKSNIRATLVEADSTLVEPIKEYFKGYAIDIHNVAIWDDNGTVQLSKAKASTFISKLKSSPALKNDNYQIDTTNVFEIQSKKFSEIDDGTIDLLSIDIEGSEWYVLKYLRSSPKIISVETHGKYYTNPFIYEIREWFAQNNYQIWYKDDSDSVYVRKDVFKVNWVEKLSLVVKGLSLEVIKLKRFLK
jgi:FkbM family methyltransferase